MMTVYVPDVGDGLAAGIRMLDNTRVQVDCGSQHDAEVALYKGLYRIEPEVFFLSHFHLDHYNGLLEHHDRWPRSTIRQAFFPRIPVFPQRGTFLRCMLAMVHWLMGDTSGSMAAYSPQMPKPIYTMISSSLSRPCFCPAAISGHSQWILSLLSFPP